MPLTIRFSEDALTEIGVDEAGRGSFWGPIVAGAVVLPSEWTDEQRVIMEQLRDSKKVSPKKRVILADGIKKHCIVGVGIVDAAEINRHGIQWANREAFRRAIAQIPHTGEVRLLIDGVIALDRWEGEQQLIVEGDNTYMAIAAASIIAKVSHDQWIHDYCDAHPECDERYHLRSSNGYGTARHREGIRLYGGHELHREQYIQHALLGRVRKAKEEFLIKL